MQRGMLVCEIETSDYYNKREISKYTYGKCAPRGPYNTMIKHGFWLYSFRASGEKLFVYKITSFKKQGEWKEYASAMV